jgi:6-pyruvoyltetrahydropterin/6-carboxytetrahydropterin synthase
MKDKHLIIGKQFLINSAHYLPKHKRCGFVHGHTWKITISLEGIPVNNMVLDFYKLSEVVNPILNRLDHKLINKLIEFPTAENISSYIATEVKKQMPVNVLRVNVKVQEGEGGYAIASL